MINIVGRLTFTDQSKTAGNMGFSAMLAEEYIPVDISLSAAVRAERINLSNRT